MSSPDVDTTTATAAPPNTTTTSTNLPTITTTTTAAPAVGPSAISGWSPECNESTGEPGRAYASHPALTGFVTLGAIPLLDLHLPVMRTEVESLVPSADVSAIPGGVLVLVGPPSSWPMGATVVESSMLVAVNEDGTVRWRRCIDNTSARGLHTAPAELAATSAWVSTHQPETGDFVLRGFDLTTGADVPLIDGLDGLTEIARSDRYVLLGRADGRIDLATDRLALVDLATGTARRLSYPKRADFQEAFRVIMRIDDNEPTDHDVTLLHLDPFDVVVGIESGDGWTTDPNSIRTRAPNIVRESFDEQRTLTAIDALGDIVWTIPDFTGRGAEGFHVAVSDGIVIANRCVEPSDAGYCEQGALIGIDAATGEQLWQLPGFREVAVLANGRALISNGAVGGTNPAEAFDGYLLIDIATGRRTDEASEFADEWTGTETFRQGCCGESEYVWVGHDAGAVWAVNGDRIRIWYPPQITAQTIDVPLAGQTES
jgi:hypothetical protein